jgi:hypothetical protein
MSTTLENKVVTVKVIETIKGKPRVMKGARVTIAPVFDESKGTTALKTGITRQEWETRYKAAFGDYDKFYEDFQIVLSEVTRTFDNSELLNELKIALLKNHPWVAISSGEITQHARYVLYDEVEEAKKENLSFEVTLKAYKYLNDMSIVERANFLKLYGFRNTANVAAEVVLKRLKAKADENPKEFVELYEDKTKDLKIMIEDMLSSRMIVKQGGVFYYGTAKEGTPLGASIEQVIEFMRDPKNNELMLQINRAIKGVNPTANTIAPTKEEKEKIKSAKEDKE